MPCPLGAVCNGSGITNCAKNMFIAGKSCAACVGSTFCNGIIQISCPSGSDLHDQTCENGSITKCLDLYLLDPDLNECQKCPSDTEYFSKKCTGSEILRCYDTTYFRGALSRNGECLPCPGKSECDGHVVVKCPIGYIIDSQNLHNCLPCGGSSQYCNGVEEVPCSTPDLHILSCKDGLVSEC